MKDGIYRKGRYLYFFVYSGRQYGWCLSRQGALTAYNIFNKEEEREMGDGINREEGNV